MKFVKNKKNFLILSTLTVLSLVYLTGFGPAPQSAQLVAKRPSISNPGVVEIAHPEQYSKVYAISDVHGMYQNLIPLLQNAGIINASGAWTAGNSLLVVVGDSIDKGPMSIEVVDFWMNLTQQAPLQGGRVLHLLGNHEAEFLADPTNDKKAAELIAELKAKGLTVDQFTNPVNPRAQFVLSMPVAAKIGDWLFCHAGFLEQPTFDAMAAKATPLLQAGQYNDPFFIGNTSLLEARKWWETSSDTRAQLENRLSSSGLFGVVFGHQPAALNVEGADAQSDDSRLIKIDNGMAPEAGSHSGSVLVFENPDDMNHLRAPTVMTIKAGNPAHVPVAGEVPGPSRFPDDDS